MRKIYHDPYEQFGFSECPFIDKKICPDDCKDGCNYYEGEGEYFIICNNRYSNEQIEQKIRSMQ